MSSAPPLPLLRRATPAAASTAPAAAPFSSSASPPTPRFPPGFPVPLCARRVLVRSLFPQLEAPSPESASPPRSADSPGSIVVLDSQLVDPPAVAALETAGAAPGAGFVVDPPVFTALETVRAARKVRFAITADVLDFTPPVPIHGAHRPCLKASSLSAINAGRRAALMSRPIPSRPSSPAAPGAHSSAATPEEGWTLVRPPYWWRALAPNNRHSKRKSSPSYPPPPSRRSFVKHHRRTCHRCLEKGHCKAQCRDPYKCLICKRSGHRAWECHSKLPSSAPLHTQRPPAPTASPAPRLMAPPMRIGDPSVRPEEGHVVITTTPEMEAQAAGLASLAAVVWLGGTRPSVSAAIFRSAIAKQFSIDRNLLRVVPHYPEDFFVRFDFQHHRDTVTAGPARFSFNSPDLGVLDIHVTNWRLSAHAEQVQAYHHVHLCLENVPLNAWDDRVAAQILGPKTFLHYFDVATVQREDATALKLWAWSADPNKIPKVQWVTFTSGPGAAGSSFSPTPAVGRQGIEKRVIVHLDIHEDYSPDANDQFPRRAHPDKFTWYYGVVDGERRIRDRRVPAKDRCREDNARDRREHDRDRDDDNNRRGRRGDRRSSSWHDRLFRSRSRAPARSEDDRRRDDRHGRDDRRYDDGRRHGAELPPPPDARRVDTSRVQRLPDGSVVPASGRRARHRQEDHQERRARDRHEDHQERRAHDRGRSPPQAQRTTSCDIIEIRPTSLVPGWLRRLGPCFGERVSPMPPMSTPLSARLETSPASDGHLTALAAPDMLNEVATSSNTSTPIFVSLQPPLLTAPSSTPPQPPVARRKTLAGVVDFALGRRSPRLKAKKHTMPIAQMAERLLCQRLGIVGEGEMITEDAISKYVALFNGQLPDLAVAALRALFQMDCDLDGAVEDALIQHGGDTGPGMRTQASDDATVA
ncbi:hypothetical protein VPH35_103332 [Triticum aestivum]|uniref:uncharacterized protein n=1 Tax=Triticum aestivum TaxID=4565 RepID=UPI001D02D618|nr:uncharacterized protein LOC123132032 [Triticum aestivum]